MRHRLRRSAAGVWESAGSGASTSSDRQTLRSWEANRAMVRVGSQQGGACSGRWPPIPRAIGSQIARPFPRGLNVLSAGDQLTAARADRERNREFQERSRRGLRH